MVLSKEIKSIARTSLKGKCGSAIGAMFLTALISCVPLCSPAVLTGYQKYNKRLIRGENPEATEVCDGFSLFGRSLWLAILMGVFVYLWSLLLIIPGIVKSFAYSMSYYILTDNENMTAREALRASRTVMKGKKGNLFCLMLSFIGWILLCTLTLGILYIWIAPYMYAAMAAFYEKNVKPELNFDKADNV